MRAFPRRRCPERWLGAAFPARLERPEAQGFGKPTPGPRAGFLQPNFGRSTRTLAHSPSIWGRVRGCCLMPRKPRKRKRFHGRVCFREPACGAATLPFLLKMWKLVPEGCSADSQGWVWRGSQTLLPLTGHHQLSLFRGLGLVSRQNSEKPSNVMQR